MINSKFGPFNIYNTDLITSNFILFFSRFPRETTAGNRTNALQRFLDVSGLGLNGVKLIFFLNGLY